MKKVLYMLLAVMVLTACGQRQQEVADANLDYAKGLTITRYRDYTKVAVLDPWNNGKVLQTYLLVPRDKAVPDTLPQGTVVRVPLQNVLVYSDVHARALKELGCVAAVRGVCDGKYFKTPEIVAGLADGTVTDCGSSMAPAIESIVGISPEAILLSPFQNAGYGALANIGVPILELADYMETNPLGRAEWMKFFGMLFDREAVADSIFSSVADNYNRMAATVKNVPHRPTVISETVTSGVWYVPGGASYKATLYADAGADYPWADDISAGSLQLDFAQVLDKAQNADFWLLTTYGYELTRRAMLDIYPHNDQFAAFGKGSVYYFNSAVVPLFEETAFHPDLLLKEYIGIFHPDKVPGYELSYFKRMGE